MPFLLVSLNFSVVIIGSIFFRTHDVNESKSNGKAQFRFESY
jgi:hypothetical protein